MTEPLANVWDSLLPVALRDLLLDEPSLVLTPLLPDSQGRQRFLVHKPDDVSGQLELNGQQTTKGKK